MEPELLAEESSAEFFRSTRPHRAQYGRVAICAAILVGVGYVGGRHNSAQGLSLTGLQTKPVYSISQFTSEFNTWSAGLTCPTLTRYVSQIANQEAIAPANSQAGAFKVWWNGILPSEQAHANTIMNTKTTEVCTPPSTPPAGKTAPFHSISSYSEFGHLYSQETAGKPWPDVMHVDELVRGAVRPHASEAIQQLNHYYLHHLTDDEKRDFDDNAVAHMNLGAVGR